MRPFRPCLCTWLALAGLVLALHTGSAVAETVNLKATLILASNETAPVDERLARVEPKLRKIFGFKHYTHYGRGSASPALPGEATLKLGHGYHLAIRADKGHKGKVRAEVKWVSGGKNLLSTTVSMTRGVPTILGGPPHKGGTLIVTLTAE